MVKTLALFLITGAGGGFSALLYFCVCREGLHGSPFPPSGLTETDIVPAMTAPLSPLRIQIFPLEQSDKKSICAILVRICVHCIEQRRVEIVNLADEAANYR